SRISTNITKETFSSLPTGRSFNSILAMAPGVRMESKAGGGGVQVDGASGSENAFILDGVDVSDMFHGSIRNDNLIPLQLIQEVQVKSGGFEAQSGGATGGVMNVASRAGSSPIECELRPEFDNN